MTGFEKFTLTETHLKLLRRANITWSRSEFGAPTIDPKRPYGNSYVIGDIVEILDAPIDAYGDVDEKVYTALYKLHSETETALQIVLETGSFEAGDYERQKYFGRWERVG